MSASYPHIFVIDRHARRRKRLHYALHDANLKTTSSSDYDILQVVESVQQEQPDLILISSHDITREDISLIRDLKLFNVPIILLNQAHRPISLQTMRQAFQAGAFDVADSPTTPPELIALIHKTLDNAVRRARSPFF